MEATLRNIERSAMEQDMEIQRFESEYPFARPEFSVTPRN
jgi:hypothetical protein